MNPQIDPAKAEALLEILESPRFQQCMRNAIATREAIAYEILTGKKPPEVSMTQAG